jgi:hypothetical protein
VSALTHRWFCSPVPLGIRRIDFSHHFVRNHTGDRIQLLRRPVISQCKNSGKQRSRRRGRVSVAALRLSRRQIMCEAIGGKFTRVFQRRQLCGEGASLANACLEDFGDFFAVRSLITPLVTSPHRAVTCRKNDVDSIRYRSRAASQRRLRTSALAGSLSTIRLWNIRIVS